MFKNNEEKVMALFNKLEPEKQEEVLSQLSKGVKETDDDLDDKKPDENDETKNGEAEPSDGNPEDAKNNNGEEDAENSATDKNNNATNEDDENKNAEDLGDDKNKNDITETENFAYKDLRNDIDKLKDIVSALVSKIDSLLVKPDEAKVGVFGLSEPTKEYDGNIEETKSFDKMLETMYGKSK
jgi:hypothetical protein